MNSEDGQVYSIHVYCNLMNSYKANSFIIVTYLLNEMGLFA